VEVLTKSVSDREEKLAQVNELIEVQLELIGSTAIEDKLQDQVCKLNFEGYFGRRNNLVHEECRN